MMVYIQADKVPFTAGNRYENTCIFLWVDTNHREKLRNDTVGLLFLLLLL